MGEDMWSLEFGVGLFFVSGVVLATLCGLQDLSSPTRDQT